MTNSHYIVENSLRIAWDYLEAAGELGNPEVASQMLLEEIQGMVRRGETRPLMLSNKAIEAYMRYRHQLALVS